MQMIEVNTADLIGAALDLAVAEVDFEGDDDGCFPATAARGKVQIINPSCESFFYYSPSTDWSQGGPLIEKYWNEIDSILIEDMGSAWPDFLNGDMLLRVFCRAIVAAKLGDTVSVPAELLATT